MPCDTSDKWFCCISHVSGSLIEYQIAYMTFDRGSDSLMTGALIAVRHILMTTDAWIKLVLQLNKLRHSPFCHSSPREVTQVQVLQVYYAPYARILPILRDLVRFQTRRHCWSSQKSVRSHLLHSRAPLRSSGRLAVEEPPDTDRWISAVQWRLHV